MPTAIEKWDGRRQTRGDPASQEVGWIIFDTDDDDAARIAMLDAAPEDWDGLPLRSTRIERRLTETTWEGTVVYSTRESKEARDTEDEVSPLNFEYEFDTGGGTQHITQSKETVGRYAPTGTAPDYQGAIGVTDDSVEGVDIVVPQYHWSETHYLTDTAVTEGYKAALYALTGRTNSGAFRSFAAGEVLFLGAAGRKRGSDSWGLTYKFAASPNLTGISIGPISGISKGGWHYLWVRYEDQVDTTTRKLVKRPASVHVERVYDAGSFSALGIG